MAFAGGAYAFGGRDASGPLDTAVAIDLSSAVDPFAVLEPRMAAPRDGHTATAVTVAAVEQVLLFGGAPAGAPVAELFVATPMPRFMPIEAGAGPGRRGHGAILLPPPDGRVLIVGGLGGDGRPRGDSVIYDPRQRAFEPSALALRKPRHAFAAFVVGGDVVVAGGLDESGAPIGDAEVFALSGLEPRAVVRAHARARATATVLTNQSVVVLGGEEAAGTPSTAVEIYQPTAAR
jgi:hypothetical protein